MDDITGWVFVTGTGMWLLCAVETAWKARPRPDVGERRPATFILGIGSAVAAVLFLGSVMAMHLGAPAPRSVIGAFWGLAAVGLLLALPARRETMRARWLENPSRVEAYLNGTRWLGRAALVSVIVFGFCLLIRFGAGWKPVWVFAFLAFIPMAGFGHAWLVRLWDAFCIRSWRRAESDAEPSAGEAQPPSGRMV